MYCILLAGMPATGKSTMAAQLSIALGLPVFSKDAVKERLFDTVGFRSRQEKVQLGVAAARIIEDCAEQLMQGGLPFILENNFEDATRPSLMALLEKHVCTALTIRLTGNMETIYRRFVERNNSPTRHRGHVVNECYPEKEPRAVVAPPSLSDFTAAMEARGMDRFVGNGPLLIVDVTDFSIVDVDGIVRWIRDQSTSLA